MEHSLPFNILIIFSCVNIYGNAQESPQPERLQDGTPAPQIPDPCDPFRPEKPDFSRSNRRLSEIKCYETIWELKYREEKEQKDLDCTLQTLRKNGAFGVISGRDVLPGEFPHMAAVGWRAAVGSWIFKCGGSLISPKFVLTAAHCSSVSSVDTTVISRIPKIVRLGDRNIIDTFWHGVRPTDVNILRIIVHPMYKSPNKYYDLALFELEKSTEFNKLIHPACLWSKNDVYEIGNKAYVTGWGVVESGGKMSSPILQVAQVDLIESNTCDQLLNPYCYRLWCGLQDHQMCAGTLAGGADTCQGDSGGPLSARIPLPKMSTRWSLHYVLGVTSFGFECGKANSPGVYTRVSSFLDWIENIVWSNQIQIN